MRGMLVIKVPEQDCFNQETSEFYHFPGCTMKMEHSLVSISKWETKWKKPFLSDDNKTAAEFLDYLRCMTINADAIPDEAYELLGQSNLIRIRNYIMDSATATVITDHRKQSQRQADTPTSEMIYYWMIANGIPFECEKWRLNRLITLIKICNVKGNPQQMSKSEVLAMNNALNKQRRAKYGSPG